MNKKVRLTLLMLAATAFNIVTTVLCFTLLLILYTLLLIPRIPPDKAFIGFPFLFAAALIMSFLLYQLALKFFLKKQKKRPGNQ
ncbi:MAG: leader peptide processing enzyme [Treponema sp.]|jgi:hypothetical protein|nr:leader peptide processing enzyme [Treponema sp.]